MAHLFELARAVNRFGNNKQARKRGGPVAAPALEAFALVAKALGLMTMSTADFDDEVKRKRLGALGLEPAKVESLLADRLAARGAKEWARADAIRDELDTLGIVVMDGTEGVRWRVRV